MKAPTIIGVILAALAALVAVAGERTPATLADVRPILEAMREDLPAALASFDESGWATWGRTRNAAIQARLEQGEIDSMVNLLLYGTSFTRQPRIQIAALAEAARNGLLRSRVNDLLHGLRSPGSNERLIFLGSLLRRQGLDPDGDDGKTGLFIYRNLQRVLQENATFARRVQETAASPFLDRGVSLDATILPNAGIEAALSALKTQALLRNGSVTRAAVVGPGLDFADKDSGYDYYPQQTLQPFALYDSLARLGLADPANLQITVFDIADRVIEHLANARQRARKGNGYGIQLPRNTGQAWSASVLEYWRTFGDRVGRPAAPIHPPHGMDGVQTRAVLIRPAVVLACEPARLDIVLDRMHLPPAERFDVIVVTNLFVYYDRFEQALALQNVSTLLKPGGILLSNDALPELPQIPMRRAGQTSIRYTDKVGDSIYWYVRQ